MDWFVGFGTGFGDSSSAIRFIRVGMIHSLSL